MDNYKRYLKERYGRDLYFNDLGFVSYSFLEEGNRLYIHDAFTRKEYRKSGVLKGFIDHVLKEFPKVKMLQADSDINDPNCVESMQTILSWKAKPIALLADGRIVFEAKI